MWSVLSKLMTLSLIINASFLDILNPETTETTLASNSNEPGTPQPANQHIPILSTQFFFN